LRSEASQEDEWNDCSQSKEQLCVSEAFYIF
jgi:hypothetical protein